MIELELPYPPSVNTYWRHPTKGRLAGRHLISEKGRAYRASVIAEIGSVIALDDRLAVLIECFPPDRRKRDLDNVAKGLLDAMTHAGVWVDDEQIDDLRIVRRDPVVSGMVRVTVRKLDE